MSCERDGYSGSELVDAGHIRGALAVACRRHRRLSPPFALLALLIFGALLWAASASAEITPEPAWQVTTAAVPSVLPPGLGRRGKYDVAIENVGGKPTSGTFTVRDVLPAGLTVTFIEPLPGPGANGEVNCGGTASEVVCTSTEPVVSGGFNVVNIEFEVTGTIGALTDVASVSGGGTLTGAQGEAVSRVGKEGERGPAGITQFKFEGTDLAGNPVTQAGGHPHFLTSTVLFDNIFQEDAASERPKPTEAVKDLSFYLPLGMLGDAAVADRCPASLVEAAQTEESGCPPGSRIGTLLLMALGSVHAEVPDPTNEHGIYNVTPEKGYAAEFAFATNRLTFTAYANVVRHDGADVVRVSVPGIPQAAALIGLVATFFGDLQEHFMQHGEEFTYDRGAFLTDPSDCSEGPQAREISVAINTWEHPETDPGNAAGPFVASLPAFSAIEGCGALSFSSTLGVAPQSTEADEPSSYHVALGVPQAPDSSTGLATPPVKNVSVTLPPGTTISPASANGLGACQETGANGINIEDGEAEEVAADGLLRPAAGHCPPSSEIASVTASTPLLAGEDQLKGHIFLASPKCGGSGQPGCTAQDAVNGNLFGLYLELRDEQAGLVLKIPGHASVDPDTGQITTSFEDNPQFPFSELDVETTSGPRGPLENSQECGPMASSGVVVPWSAPYTPAATPSSSFEVTGCSGAFAPTFSAGTVSPQAGAHSTFTLTLNREDREQNISTISTTLPQGLLASVANVAQCPEPQAALGGCPAASEVGTTTVGVGSGPQPYYETGHVFLTGPYAGVPFGLSVVVPAVAGPFNLGQVIVRVALSIDPNTAQVTATSSPLPQIIDGVPLRMRTIAINLDNPSFTLNPTNCAQRAITGQINSTQGNSAPVSAPFRAQGCQNLAFKPTLTASTVASTSKANGASLSVKVVSAPGQANIAKVDLTLPQAFPSRLSTLQKACTEAQFNQNPAGCPEASNIGVAKAITPLLKVPLSGPAYLVSHGGAAFPDVEFVLQGEGVRIDLDGKTQITKGITYSRFETVPDAPISSFETVLPEGPHSVLAAFIPASAHGSLCGQALKMPTTLTGQNGAVINQATPISVSGCTPKITITNHKLAKGRLAVTVLTAVGGTVSIGAAGLKTTRASLPAGTHTINVSLNSKGRTLRDQQQKMAIKATLKAGVKTVASKTSIRL